MIGQYYQLNFFFKPPQGEFDQTKVKGKLFTLFRPKERIHERAIEIGAAGKLYNIVVDNEHTSKYLIEQ